MKKSKQPVKVYLVEDHIYSPGRIYAVFADKDAAFNFRDNYHPNNANVVSRTLLFGQHVSGFRYIE